MRGGCINNRYFIRFTKLQAICVLFEPEGFAYEFVNNSKNFTVKFQKTSVLTSKYKVGIVF